MQHARSMGRASVLDLAGTQSGQPRHRLSRRPATATDHDFLFALFAESRPDLGLLPDDARVQLTRMQFESQLSQYRSGAPDAVDWILELDHVGAAEAVGRCYLRQGRHEHRLIDLSIRRQWRRHGFAGSVLAELCAGAAQAGVPLRLTVWQDNRDAQRLYRRHGFVADHAKSRHAGAIAEAAGYVPLRWSKDGCG